MTLFSILGTCFVILPLEFAINSEAHIFSSLTAKIIESLRSYGSRSYGCWHGKLGLLVSTLLPWALPKFISLHVSQYRNLKSIPMGKMYCFQKQNKTTRCFLLWGIEMQCETFLFFYVERIFSHTSGHQALKSLLSGMSLKLCSLSSNLWNTCGTKTFGNLATFCFCPDSMMPLIKYIHIMFWGAPKWSRSLWTILLTRGGQLTESCRKPTN